MKNLKAFGVEEMNSNELQLTDGGFIPLILIGCAVLLSSCTINVTVGDDNTVNGTTSADSTGNGNSVDAKLK